MTATDVLLVANKRHPALTTLRFNGRMTRLGELLRLYRAVHQQTVRECADEIGIHFATLNRFERTDGGMTADSFMKILIWLLSPSPKASDRNE